MPQHNLVSYDLSHVLISSGVWHRYLTASWITVSLGPGGGGGEADGAIRLQSPAPRVLLYCYLLRSTASLKDWGTESPLGADSWFPTRDFARMGLRLGPRIFPFSTEPGQA